MIAAVDALRAARRARALARAAPGDIVVRREHLEIPRPDRDVVVVSFVLTLLLNLFFRLWGAWP